nr:immunoglobulin heavy chain junction region [Macaca mulatta]
CTKTEDSLDVW